MKPALTALHTLMLFSATLCGCTMAPDYLRPALPVDEKWRAPLEEESGEAQQAASSIVWREFFKSAALQKTIETALAHNRDLRVAALNVEAARALYRIERADLFPVLSAQTSLNREKSSDAQNSIEPLQTTYRAELASTAFELDVFGRIRSENEAALQDYFASVAARDALQISLIAETAHAYLQWLADRDILSLVKETLDAQQKSYKLISQRFEAGIASKLDLAQIRQSLEAAQVNLAIYTRRVQQDENALALLTGVSDIDEIIVSESLSDVTLMDRLPAGLPSEVLLTRPDIRQAEHALQAANAAIGAARAAFFPRISLTGSYGYASSSLSDLVTSSAAGAWNFSPQITLPLFEAGRNKATLDYTKLIKEASVARYEQAIQIAFREVSDALVTRSTLAEELRAQRQLAEAAKEAYDLSYARYKEGIDSFLSVLDAQRTLFAARQQSIEVEKETLTNLITLYKTLGGGAADAQKTD